MWGYVALSLLEEDNLSSAGYIAIGLVGEDLQRNLGVALRCTWTNCVGRMQKLGHVWVTLLLVLVCWKKTTCYVLVTLLLAWWKKISK